MGQMRIQHLKIVINRSMAYSTLKCLDMFDFPKTGPDYMCLSCPHAMCHAYLQNLVNVASDRGSVVFWRYCNALCTFGFVDDDTPSSSSRKGAISVA